MIRISLYFNLLKGKKIDAPPEKNGAQRKGKGTKFRLNVKKNVGKYK